uniref:C2H2-type domain-containing protein n=1 Tax=Setaria digitata TaxID=48799 RepID=A0A915PHX9_9BILA
MIINLLLLFVYHSFLLQRSRTIYVPVAHEECSRPVEDVPEAFRVPAVEGLPERFRKLLVAPHVDSYTVVGNGSRWTGILCGFCAKEFGMLKGWRIHAAKMHTGNAFVKSVAISSIRHLILPRRKLERLWNSTSWSGAPWLQRPWCVTIALSSPMMIADVRLHPTLANFCGPVLAQVIKSVQLGPERFFCEKKKEKTEKEKK